MRRWAESLTRLPLAEADEVLSEEQRASRAEELTRALRVDVPVLNYLQASALVTAEVVTDNRLWLLFQLADPFHGSFNFLGSQVRHRFLQEVQKARAQLETVEWRIREAIGEARTPRDGVADGADESSTRAIRERVRRNSRGGQLLIPGLEIGRFIDIGPVPATLPRGPRLRVSAQVTSMTRTRAALRRVVIASSEMPRAKDIAGVFECVELERDTRSDHLVFGEVLRQAMDTEARIELAVTVVLDWATGIALRFQIVS